MWFHLDEVLKQVKLIYDAKRTEGVGAGTDQEEA